MVNRILSVAFLVLFSANGLAQQPPPLNAPPNIGPGPQGPTGPVDPKPVNPLDQLQDLFSNGNQTELPKPETTGDGSFNQSDPTQAAPDIRRILEGDQTQTQREPPPQIVVAGKIVGANGTGRAILRVNQQYMLVQEGMQFTIPTSFEPIVYTVKAVTVSGVDLESGLGSEKQKQRIP